MSKKEDLPKHMSNDVIIGGKFGVFTTLFFLNTTMVLDGTTISGSTISALRTFVCPSNVCGGPPGLTAKIVYAP
jgi:hypothetical protein